MKNYENNTYINEWIYFDLCDLSTFSIYHFERIMYTLIERRCYISLFDSKSEYVDTFTFYIESKKDKSFYKLLFYSIRRDIIDSCLEWEENNKM